jgi:hypothetical protein
LILPGKVDRTAKDSAKGNLAKVFLHLRNLPVTY